MKFLYFYLGFLAFIVASGSGNDSVNTQDDVLEKIEDKRKSAGNKQSSSHKSGDKSGHENSTDLDEDADKDVVMGPNKTK